MSIFRIPVRRQDRRASTSPDDGGFHGYPADGQRRRCRAPATKSKWITRYLPTAGRIGLGLIFFVCGLDGFLHFLPQPTGPIPDGAMAFGGALFQTGYMFPLIKATETIAGALLLANLFVPLALALLAPVIVNIFAFHAVLAPDGTGLAAILLLLEIYLAWSYRNVYRHMLAVRARPDTK